MQALASIYGQKQRNMTDKPKTDRRIERTRTALRNALLALVRREEWAEINVREICREANIARSSFYLHYDNKTDLLDSVFASGMRDARAYVKANTGEKGRYASISWLVEHVLSNRDFYRKGPLSNDEIYLRFQRSFAELLKGELGIRQDIISRDALSFAVGGVFAVLKGWDVDNKELSVSVLSDRINDFADLVLAGELV